MNAASVQLRSMPVACNQCIHGYPGYDRSHRGLREPDIRFCILDARVEINDATDMIHNVVVYHRIVIIDGEHASIIK